MRQFSNACVAHEKVSAPGRSRLQLAAALLCVAVCSSSNFARADDGGVSFWVPGFFGSLAATPQQPGFSLALIYYHSSVSAGGDVAFARRVNRGVSMLIPYGRVRANVDATLTGAVGPLGFTVSGSREDVITGFGDLAPMFNVRWNAGVHNFMTYITGNLTTGRYDPTRLANLGIGHNAIDAGGAYTYFNPQTRHEFSATLGFTYNFENVHTDYQNGIDMLVGCQHAQGRRVLVRPGGGQHVDRVVVGRVREQEGSQGGYGFSRQRRQPQGLRSTYQ